MVYEWVPYESTAKVPGALAVSVQTFPVCRYPSKKEIAQRLVGWTPYGERKNG